jgi:AraC-like DNA-binding protein
VPQRPQLPTQVHYHDYTELVIIEAGRGTHQAGQQRLGLHPGDVFVVPPGFPHGYVDVDGLRLLNLCFDTSCLNLPLAALQSLPGWQGLFAIDPARRLDHGFRGHLHLSEDDRQTVVRDVERVQSECEEGQDGHELAATALLQYTLVRLCRLYEDQLGSDPELARLALLLATIDGQLDRSLSVAVLADQAHVSEPTLQRRFREAFGCSVMQWVARRRLQTAKDLLGRSGLGVAQIGQRVGMPDANYFSRWFRQQAGVAPTAYRMPRP